jgi:hypothetical protein
MKRIVITSLAIAAVASFTSVPATAQVFIINENFNGSSLSGGARFGQYYGGDCTSYANGIVAGVGTGGTGGWEIVLNAASGGTAGYSYMGAQYQNGGVTGNTNANLSNYTLSFDARATGGSLNLQLQSWTGAGFGGTMTGTLNTAPASPGYGNDLTLYASYTHYSLNLGNTNIFKGNSGFLPNGGTLQISFQFDGGGATPYTDTLYVDNLQLTMVTALTENPAFSGLTASQSAAYGSAVTLSGTVSAAGPIYPAMGETVTVTVNGNAQTTTINDATGHFSFVYNLSTIPASANPYTITYIYAGDSLLFPATNTSTTLTVNPAPLTVTASPQSKTYGQSLTFGSGSTKFTSGGLQNGETIGSVTLAVSGNGGAATAPVSGSPYTITPSAATGGTFNANNYAITYNTGTLTVSAVPLTVTANNAMRPYGQANPAFTGTIVGVMNNDNITATYTCSATTNSPPGTYLIVPSLNDPNNRLGNYTVTTNNGTLTVDCPIITLVPAP